MREYPSKQIHKEIEEQVSMYVCTCIPVFLEIDTYNRRDMLHVHN